MLDTNIWSVFVGNKAEYAIAGPTVELLCASYKDTHPDKYIVYTVGDGETGYKGKWSDTSDDTYGYVGDIPYHDFNKIYFRSGQTYWIVAPYYSYGEGIMRMAGHAELGWMDSYWCWDAVGELKPVVCLKSNVKLKRIQEGTYTIK